MLCDGYDLLQGGGANRDRAASEEVPVLYASTSVHPYVDDTDDLTLIIDTQFAASAELTIHLYVALGA